MKVNDGVSNVEITTCRVPFLFVYLFNFFFLDYINGTAMKVFFK